MIIAEVGQNHCGDMGLAEKLIVLAQLNGADLVKFQLYDSEKLYGKYQDTELSKKQAQHLFGYGQTHNIEVFFSVFDVERVEWCEEIGVKRYKIAYSQNSNMALWEMVAQTGRNIIISCLPPYKVPSQVTYQASQTIEFLHCISKYPTQLTELQFPDEFVRIGFSDHTIGLDAAKIALCRGAKIIEKHFAINHQTGVDAPWSMTPSELAELARFELALKEILCQI